jgi:glutathione S-transferase
MILIGQYDSSYVRRVGIALTLYELPFEHRPLSAFGDAEAVRALNPLGRVPTLILDDGEALADSHMILDHLDGLVPEAKSLVPRSGEARRRALQVAALATGFADRMVSLYYEKHYHPEPSQAFIARLTGQIMATLAVLEADRATRSTAYWFGDALGHADIAVAAALRHMNEAHPGLVDMTRFPALAAHAARLEALPVFEQISQPFFIPS